MCEGGWCEEIHTLRDAITCSHSIHSLAHTPTHAALTLSLSHVRRRQLLTARKGQVCCLHVCVRECVCVCVCVCLSARFVDVLDKDTVFLTQPPPYPHWFSHTSGRDIGLTGGTRTKHSRVGQVCDFVTSGSRLAPFTKCSNFPFDFSV